MVNLRWPGKDDWLEFLRRAGVKPGRTRTTPVKVPVKIVCSCGQKYSFEVYPLNGQMPLPVRCPVCGVDGTATANQAIAHALQVLAAPPPRTPAAPAPAPASAHPTLRPRSLASPPTGAANGEVEAWRQRALEAERRAEQVQAVAQANLAPHLVQALRETVVQELATQRRELLKAQEEAALEIAAMIRRFDSVQAPLQDRLRSYESRIQELEKELTARNEENRELLKLKIDMIRHQLEVERVHNRLSFTPN